jgi:hypothetical protein
MNLSPEYHLVRDEFASQHANPPSNDQAIRGLAGALLEEAPDTQLTQAIDGLAKARLGTEHPLGGSTVSEVAGLIRTCISAYVITASKDSHKKFSYEGFDGSKWRPWLKKVNGALAMPETRADEQLLLNFETGIVMTSVASRYNTVELLAQLLRPRWGKDVWALDIGSGIMEGPNQIFKKKNFPMSVDRVRHDDEPKGSDDLTEKVNRLLALPTPISNYVCLDQRNVYLPHRKRFDPNVVTWVRAGMRPEKEYSNPNFRQTFDGVIKHKNSHVHFKPLNVLRHFDAEKFEEEYGGRKFHIIGGITVWHQLRKQGEIEAMYSWMRDHLADGGIIIGQEHARLQNSSGRPAPIGSLRIERHWHVPDRYKTFVEDAAHPAGPGLQEAFSSLDSRCKDIFISHAALAADGGLKEIQELIS